MTSYVLNQVFDKEIEGKRIKFRVLKAFSASFISLTNKAYISYVENGQVNRLEFDPDNNLEMVDRLSKLGFIERLEV